MQQSDLENACNELLLFLDHDRTQNDYNVVWLSLNLDVRRINHFEVDIPIFLNILSRTMILPQLKIIVQKAIFV